MTKNWSPNLEMGNKRLYLAIVEALENDISSGELHSGDRLPTHRELADRLGVAIGTVTRAYGEAERRGLIFGDGRRGTFAGKPTGGMASLTSAFDPEAETIDFSNNYPAFTEDPDLSKALRKLAWHADNRGLLRYQSPVGLISHRTAGAKWIAASGLQVEPDSVIITYGAQHALTVIFSSITEPNDTIAVSEYTYPGMKAIAALLRLKLEGIQMDREGLNPEALEAACRKKKIRALYCNPTLQNPTNGILSETRRKEIATVAEKYNLLIIEDEILRRLIPRPPPLITSLVPERGFLIASVSKVISGGLRVAYIISPSKYRETIINTLGTINLMTAPLPVEIASQWINDGTTERIIKKRRKEAERRQNLALNILEGYEFQSHPLSYHLWLHLPDHWNPGDLALEAHRRGVAVAPSEFFAAGRATPINAIRICLGAVPGQPTLKKGLEILVNILGGRGQIHVANV
jgi:DNA-binding transcriptional MocR family regulator